LKKTDKFAWFRSFKNLPTHDLSAGTSPSAPWRSALPSIPTVAKQKAKKRVFIRPAQTWTN